MIAVDSNILINAHRNDSEFHGPALTNLTALAEGPSRWAIPWPCVHEFYSLVTNPRVFVLPTSIETALAAIRVWLDSPNGVAIGEGPGYFDLLGDLLRKSRATGGTIHDARIAAICIDNGVSRLWTADRDFSRFKDLVTENPLV